MFGWLVSSCMSSCGADGFNADIPIQVSRALDSITLSWTSPSAVRHEHCADDHISSGTQKLVSPTFAVYFKEVCLLATSFFI
jgi:hypothetical protein